MIQGVSKREQQITDQTQIQKLLDAGKVLHLGLSVDNEPYVIPMNYGYVMEDEKLVLYLHSAVRGKKLDMIREYPKVYFEFATDLQPFGAGKPCQYGLAYSAVLGKGIATIVEDVEEKKQAMTVLMKTQTGKDFTFTEEWVSIVAVIRIDVTEYTAKHRLLPEKLR